MGAGYPGWLLSVDFGTSNTAAGHIDEATGTVQTLPLSYNGNLMPSVAYVHVSGQIDVGETALNEAAIDPRGYLPAPKRLLTLGQTTFEIGEWTVSADQVVAAVLRAVLARAAQQHHGRMPDGLVLTHPEGWSGHQIRVLIDAAVELGCPPHLVRTVSEPQAAAHFYAGHTEIGAGDRIAVFDFGGGTLDVAVLTAVPDGSFEVAAAVSDNALGGGNFDAAIRRWVDDELSQRNSDLTDVLQADATTGEQRALEDSIRQAKEMLSQTSQAVIDIYAGSRHETLLLRRMTFEGLIAAEVTRAAQLAQSTFHMAGVGGGDLRAICLTGGSTRIPLLQQQIKKLGSIATLDDPKTVIARGALLAARRFVTAPPQQAAPPYSVTAPSPPPEPPEPDQHTTPRQFKPAQHPPMPEQPDEMLPHTAPEPQPTVDSTVPEANPDLFATSAPPPWEFTADSDYDSADYDSEYADADRTDYSTPAPLFPGPPRKDGDMWSGKSGATPLGSGGRGVPWRTILLVVGVLVVVGALTAVAILGSGNHHVNPAIRTTTAVPATTSNAGATTTPPRTTCTGAAGAGTTNLPGGQTSPIDVVNALQYAYYVQRDPSAVINLYAPNTLTDIGKQQIASFVAGIPAGTTYCVTASQGADPLTVNYDVTETRPNVASSRYRMFLEVSPTAPYTIVALGQQK